MREIPVDEVRAALEGVYAASWAYGRAGALLDRRATALSAIAGFQSDRDWLRSLLIEAGEEPPAPAIAYELSGPVDSANDAAALLAEVEQRLAPIWAELASQLSGRSRARAVRALQTSAVRAVTWGASSEAFVAPVEG